MANKEDNLQIRKIKGNQGKKEDKWQIGKINGKEGRERVNKEEKGQTRKRKGR